jgi:dihydroneopterin aldolase
MSRPTKVGDAVIRPGTIATLQTSIRITDLELHGHHGYFDEEQRLGQKFLFNVVANLAPAETHLADSFEASIRYDQLIEEIECISNQSKFRTRATQAF